MDISSKECLGLTSSPLYEHDWEDVFEDSPITPPQAQPKGTEKLPRHKLRSYTCCIGKQRRTTNPYICNPIISRVSTTEDLETFRNTVSNSKPFCASIFAPTIGSDEHPKLLSPEPEKLESDSSSSSSLPAECSTKKVSFATRKTILIYSNHKNKKRPLSPQPDQTYPETQTNQLGYIEALDCTKDHFISA